MNLTLPEPPVLIVDDDKVWFEMLKVLLENSLGLTNVKSCLDSRLLMEMLGKEPVSLVLLDVAMPHTSGEELLPQIKGQYPEIPVLMLSGHEDIDLAVRCIKNGAFDYFVKRVDEKRLLDGIRHALMLHSLHVENLNLKHSFLSESLAHPEQFGDIVTRSSKMMKVFCYIEAIAKSKEPVLITGDSGVGKELAAKAVHRLSSPEGPWIAVNVAGLDDQVFSDTLFGHVRGAYTDARENRTGLIEQARNGVLFLDEIGDLSQESQIKLLRLLQENEYLPLGSDQPEKAQARFVFATNQSLEDRVKDGSIRKDLYYRLKTHQIRIPPLCDRPEDIALLLDCFLTEAAEKMGKKKPTTPEQLLTLLLNYHFPGNVRELRSMVHDAVALHQHGVLSMTSFQESMASSKSELLKSGDETFTCSTDKQPVFPLCLPTLKEMANLLVDEALRRTNGNQTQAARLLGVTRAALGKRLKARSAN